jgi:hypothetical protein
MISRTLNKDLQSSVVSKGLSSNLPTLTVRTLTETCGSLALLNGEQVGVGPGMDRSWWRKEIVGSLGAGHIPLPAISLAHSLERGPMTTLAEVPACLSLCTLNAALIECDVASIKVKL